MVSMTRCSFCGKEVSLPFKCSYCGEWFCGEHRLPERHECPKLDSTVFIKPSMKRDLSRKREEPVVYRETKREPVSNGKVKQKQGGSKTKAILGLLLVVSLAANLLQWEEHSALSLSFENGVKDGYERGHQSGYSEGYGEGYLQGVENGVKSGYNEGYNEGYIIGDKKGYEQGYKKGNTEGYDEGYLQGVKDGVGRGFNIRDPTYNEVLQFIAEDETESREYDLESFVCYDFATTVKINAFDKGYRCFRVEMRFPEELLHAIVGFNTTDRGFIYVEPQTDEIVSVEIGEPYYDKTIFTEVDYNDTVINLYLIP